MFSLGTPVSAFDIAQVVQSVMKDKGKVKAKPQASIIESLIEEALLEFTSLTDEEKAEAERKEANAAKSPSEPGAYVDPTNWADEFSASESSRDAGQGLGGKQLEVGNLSALEDDQSVGSAADLAHDDGEADDEAPAEAPARKSVREPVRAAEAPTSLKAVALAGDSAALASKSNPMQSVVIAVVVAAVAFAVAWFTFLKSH
jgi:hypothetical protein